MPLPSSPTASDPERDGNAEPPPGSVVWWLRSKTIYGLLALLVAFCLSKFAGHAVDPRDAQTVNLTDSLIAFIGSVLVAWGRAHAEERLVRVHGERDRAEAALIDSNYTLNKTAGQDAPIATAAPEAKTEAGSPASAARPGAEQGFAVCDCPETPDRHLPDCPLVRGGFADTRLLAAILLIVLFGFLAEVYLTSCSARTDRDFRSRVQSVGVNASATREEASGDVSGTGGITIQFRDPRTSGTAK